MAENLSIALGARGTYFIKPRFNDLVKREGIQFNGDSFEDDYELVHQMSDHIEMCLRAAFIILIVRMG